VIVNRDAAAVESVSKRISLKLQFFLKNESEKITAKHIFEAILDLFELSYFFFYSRERPSERQWQCSKATRT